jgi:hypothetical protein
LRSVPAVASALAWLGSGIRGILMSRIAERIGTRSTVIFVSLMIGLGLSISTFGPPAASGGTGRTKFHHPTHVTGAYCCIAQTANRQLSGLSLYSR